MTKEQELLIKHEELFNKLINLIELYNDNLIEINFKELKKIIIEFSLREYLKK